MDLLGIPDKGLRPISLDPYRRCHDLFVDIVLICIRKDMNPDPLEDLESRSPKLGPYTTKGTL